jgi:PKD repeat protein
MTKWIWSFPGASYVSDSTISNPKVVYALPGQYDVHLTVKNGLGENSKTVTSMIEILKSECAVDSFANLSLDLRERNNYASLKRIPELNHASGFTCSAWIKLNSLQDCFTQILSNWNSNVGFGFGFAFLGYRSNTNLTFYWKNVPYQLTSPFNLDTNKWIHVAFVVFPDSVRLYRNGESWTYKGNFKDFNLSETPWEIGKGVPGQCGDFSGELDELKLYNRSLSEQEIRSEMHLIHPEGEFGLVAYYQFNESSDDIYNKAGAYHGVNGGGRKIYSTAPVGTGFSAHSQLQNGQTKLDATGLQIESNQIISKNTSWHCYHLFNAPDSLPISTGIWDQQYWIVRAFGFNGIQAAVNFEISDTSIHLENYEFAPQYLRLYKRYDANEFNNNWEFVANASSVDVNTRQILFKPIPGISGQFAIEILKNPTVGVDDTKTNDLLFVFPNPANSEINIRFESPMEKSKMEILDVTGKSCFNLELQAPFSVIIPLTNLKHGVYFLRYGGMIKKICKL